jgi:hypothetical protein
MKLSPALTVWLGCACLVAEVRSADTAKAPRSPEVTARIARAVKAAGGEERLLRYFTFKDRVLIGEKDTGFGTKRESVMDAPRSWWLKTPAGYTERKTEPAKFLVWGWTLGAITDPASTMEAIPDVRDGDQELWGLRVSGTITPPMELYFARTNDLLARIDWRSDIHRFSDWKSAAGGFKYPARVVGHKKATGKIWYFDDVTEVTPLSELPEAVRTQP